MSDNHDNRRMSRLRIVCPAMMAKLVHPMVPLRRTMLECIIVSLNDDYKWSREQIADWLESLDLDITLGAPE